jgi:hypothetical protein
MDRWAEPPIMEGPKTDGASGTSPSPGLSVLHTRRFARTRIARHVSSLSLGARIAALASRIARHGHRPAPALSPFRPFRPYFQPAIAGAVARVALIYHHSPGIDIVQWLTLWASRLSYFRNRLLHGN